MYAIYAYIGVVLGVQCRHIWHTVECLGHGAAHSKPGGCPSLSLDTKTRSLVCSERLHGTTPLVPISWGGCRLLIDPDMDRTTSFSLGALISSTQPDGRCLDRDPSGLVTAVSETRQVPRPEQGRSLVLGEMPWFQRFDGTSYPKSWLIWAPIQYNKSWGILEVPVHSTLRPLHLRAEPLPHYFVPTAVVVPVGPNRETVGSNAVGVAPRNMRGPLGNG